MWKKADDPGLDWYRRNVHQDMASLFLSVHDEADLVVDRHLLKPVMVGLNKVAEAKMLFDRFGLPFINFYFDNEYDDWGSFTASGGFNPYKYMLDCVLQRMGGEAEALPEAPAPVPALSPEVEKSAMEAVLSLAVGRMDDFERVLSMVDPGGYRLRVRLHRGEDLLCEYEYDRLVSPESLAMLREVGEVDISNSKQGEVLS